MATRPTVYVVADNITSPLGSTTSDNFEQLKQGVSGIAEHSRPDMSALPFYAALFGKDEYRSKDKHTRFEQLLIASVGEALATLNVDVTSPDTVLIISTTKGNISLLEDAGGITPGLEKRLSLQNSAKLVAAYFEFINTPVVVSHACISGLVAMITGTRLLQGSKYKTAVVVGADVISKFILSGFQSFQAISNQPCKPFDASRDGINLGEGAATVVLSTDDKYKGCVAIAGGAITNDANHISGPSRTGQELCYAINAALRVAGLLPTAIDLISAHGTATLYNDEMEAKAVTLAGLQQVPLNGLKGYYGHTLGASGLIESIISMQSMREGIIIPTKGFSKLAEHTAINVCRESQQANISHTLKIASGFGGCNAAVILSKT